MAEQPLSQFEKTTKDQATGNLVTDFWYFLRNNKKWWLLPILLVLLLFGAIMLLSGSAVAPFIYTLF
jgi:hypothetical protein